MNNRKNRIDNPVLTRWIKKSLNMFFEKDSFLIKNNIHEQAFSNKIACYLSRSMKDYLLENNLNIDCEYNKVWEDTKSFRDLLSSFIWDDYIVKDSKWKILYNFWKLILSYKKYRLVLIKECGETIIGVEDSNWEITKSSKNIRPDIIIHHRIDNKCNLCVFEIKKEKLSDTDILKLKWFTNKKLNFWYDYWIWLSEFTETSVCLSLFINWENINKVTMLFWLNRNQNFT